jgi:hypothetical protein
VARQILMGRWARARPRQSGAISFSECRLLHDRAEWEYETITAHTYTYTNTAHTPFNAHLCRAAVLRF